MQSIAEGRSLPSTWNDRPQQQFRKCGMINEVLNLSANLGPRKKTSSDGTATIH